MNRKNSRRLALAAAVAVPSLFGSTSAEAVGGGAFSSAAFTTANQMTDTNVGLNNTTKIYQNAANITGPALTINGVPFSGSTTATTGPNYTLAGATTPFTTNAPSTNAGSANLLTGQLAALVTDFTYGGNPAVLTLNGLTAGQTYVFTSYNVAFGGAGTRIMSSITGTDGGTAVNFDQNVSGSGNGNLLRYTFLASGASEVLTFTPQVAGNTYHFYGFSNEQVFTTTYNQTGGGSFNTGSNFTNTAVPALNGQVPNGVGSNVSFGPQASATTITLDAPVTLGHIQFDGTGSYTLSGTNTLTFQADVGGASALSVLAGTHTIATPVVLATDAVKLGAGTLALPGTNFAGGNHVLGIGAGLLQPGAATTLQSTIVGIDTANGLQIPSGFGTFTVAGLSGTSAQSLTDTAATAVNLTLGNSGPVSSIYSGALSGASSVTKVGTSSQTFRGANTYTGTTTINGGVLGVAVLGNGGVASGLGASSNAAANLIINGATLQYSGAAAATTDRLFTVGTAGAAIDASGGGAVTFSNVGPVAFAGTGDRTLNLTGASSAANTFATTVPDVPGGGLTTLQKSGGGTWVVSGTNTYTGETLFSGGVFNATSVTNYGVAGSLGARTLAQENPLTGNGIGLHFTGGTLQYTGSTPQSTDRNIRVSLAGAVIDASGSNPSATLSFTRTAPNLNLFDTGGTRTITLQGSNTGTNTFGILIENQAGNLTSLTKNGAGTWFLPGTNSFGGVTTLNGGILNVASIANSGSNSSLGNRGAEGGGNVGILFRGGTLQYTGSTPQTTNRQVRVSTVGGAFIDASGSNPSATLSFTYTGTNTDFFENGGARQLTFTGSNTGTNTFAIRITETGGLTSVNKTGAGTWVLTGTNAYTGPTTITGGTLAIGFAGVGSTAGSAVTAQSGGTLAGSGTIGASGTVNGSVAINLGGKIAPGNSIGTLTVAGPVTFGTNGAGALPTYVAELGPGNTSDLLALTGTSGVLTLSNPDALNLLTSNAGTFTIATFASEAGVFDTVQINGLPAVVGTDYSIAYNPTSIVVTVNAVPEPGSLTLVGVGAIGLLAARRRRKNV